MGEAVALGSGLTSKDSGKLSSVCPAAVVNRDNDGPSQLLVLWPSPAPRGLSKWERGEGGRWQLPAPPRLPGSQGALLPAEAPEFSPSWRSKAFSCRDRIFPVGPGQECHLSVQTPSPGEPLPVSCRSTRQQVGMSSRVTRRGRGPGRILGWARERSGDFSPEIQTIGQSVLDRFRSSEVGKKNQKM